MNRSLLKIICKSLQPILAPKEEKKAETQPAKKESLKLANPSPAPAAPKNQKTKTENAPVNTNENLDWKKTLQDFDLKEQATIDGI